MADFLEKPMIVRQTQNLGFISKKRMPRHISADHGPLPCRSLETEEPCCRELDTEQSRFATTKRSKVKIQNYHIKWKSYMHEVLNLDEIKN